MRKVRLTPAASSDIDEIALFTEENWGVPQRRRYLAALDGAFTKLASNPGISAPRDDLGPGVRSFRVGAHVVFSVSDAEALIILRVLHARRDMQAAFRPAGRDG